MMILQRKNLRLFLSILLIGMVSITSCKKRKYKAEEKSPKWSVNTNGDTGWSSPLIGNDGTVYIGDAGGYLTAATSAGVQLWSVKLGADLSGGSATMNAAGDKIYVPEQASPGRIFCVNPTDGSLIWEWTLPAPSHLTATPQAGQQLGGGINSSPALSADESTIYFGTGNWMECNGCEHDIYDDRFIALDVSGSPTLKWELKGTQVDAIQHEDRVSFWANPSIAPNGTIYIGNFNGFLYHIQDDGPSFTILHRFNFDAVATELASDEGIAPEIWSSCAIGDDGTVYTQSIMGKDGLLAQT